MDDDDPQSDSIMRHKRVNSFVRFAKKKICWTSDDVGEGIVEKIWNCFPNERQVDRRTEKK